MFYVFEIIAFEHLAEISLKEWREYMWSVVNALRNSPKIWDLNKTDDFEVNLSSMNRNLW